jgi:hypothetical protein
MRRSVFSRVIFTGLVAFLVSACVRATVDKPPVAASVAAPDPTRGDLVWVPYNPSLPYYVLTVEPFTFDADGSPSGSTPVTPGTRYGWGPGGWGAPPNGSKAPTDGATEQMGNAIASQLVTALGNAGNIRLIDYAYYWQRKDKPASMVRKNGGEVGPFLIRGSVKEFNEIVAEARRTGSVAMDVSIIDPMDGRVAGTVNANGTSTSQSAANGFSLFGFGKASNAFPATALGQANRAALNSATQQIVARLSRIK